MHLRLNSPPQADYRPPQNAHSPECAADCAFFVGRCLALERDLLFLR
jgi:hypothetical protein